MCVPASVHHVPILMSIVDVVCELDLSVLDVEVDEPQTLSIATKRGASVAWEQEQYKRANTNMEATPFQSVPKSTPVKAVPECLKNRAPPPPKGTPSQQEATWLGPPHDPPPGLAEGEPQRWRVGADVNPPWQWNARDRVLIQSMEDYLKKIDFSTLRSPS